MEREKKISWIKCFTNRLQYSLNLTNTMLWQKRNIFVLFTSRYKDFLCHECWFSNFQMTAYHSKMHCCVTQTATEAPGIINEFYFGSYEKSILIKVSTCPLQIFGCKGLILHFASVEVSVREIRQGCGFQKEFSELSNGFKVPGINTQITIFPLIHTYLKRIGSN